MVPRVGVEPTRPYGQRILSPISRTKPSLTKHDKPIFTGIVSRQSQLHSGRFKMESRHLHVIRATEPWSVGHVRETPFNGDGFYSGGVGERCALQVSLWRDKKRSPNVPTCD